MKKGFTLIELLAVIIVLGIVGMIAVGAVSNNIKVSKKKTFEINASNLLDAAKEYVTKNMENNDFPEGGIEANNKELGIKNNPFISGIIKRNEEGQIVLEEVTDGKYCANGPKSNIEITEGNCEATDDKSPTLKIKELKTTSTGSKIMIKTQDSVSGVEKYTYCIAKIEEDYKEEDCVIVEKNKEKKLIKEIKELEQLDSNTSYTIKVTALDGNENEATEEITIKTAEIEKPKFKISTTTYALTKKLTIIYPEVDERYKKYYQIDKETPIEVEVFENEIEIKENATVKAYITKEDKEIVSNEIIITGIDQEGPSVNVEIPNLDDWTKEKTMVISAEDTGVGLALKPYINNGYKEEYSKWNRKKKVTLSSSGKLNIKARDRLGNINKTFKLNGEDCNVDAEDLCGINRIDSISPEIEINVIEGTTINNEKYKDWYNSDSVTVEIKLIDYYLYNGKNVEGGSGVDESTLKVKVTNEINNKSTTETFTPTKIGENNYRIELTKSGENKIEVSVSDNVGNKGTANLTVKIDNETPTIKAKANPKKLQKNAEYTFTENLTVAYGSTDGTVICSPANKSEKKNNLKPYIVTCTATGNNGKTSLTKFNVKHYVDAEKKCDKKNCTVTDECTDYNEGNKTGYKCKYICPNGKTDYCTKYKVTTEEEEHWHGCDPTICVDYYSCSNYPGTTLDENEHRCYY